MKFTQMAHANEIERDWIVVDAILYTTKIVKVKRIIFWFFLINVVILFVFYKMF